MKKASMFCLLIGLFLLISACGSKEVSTTKELTADDVVTAFKTAGLEAENVREMTVKDYGMAPKKAKEGKRFFIPSLGEDAGGRIMVFEQTKDLEQTKEYYDKLGKESAVLFSWTLVKGNVLVQINGSLKEETFNKYKDALK